MDNQDMYDLIESYLDNTLNKTQKQELERRISADDTIRRELELRRELRSRFSDPMRLRLRETLAGIINETASFDNRPKYEHWMRTLYRHYAQALGERPVLVFAFLLLVSGLLYCRLVYFVSEAPRGIFGWPKWDSALLMGGGIALVCMVLLWRLTVADRTLRRMVLDKYREAIRLIDSNAKATVRDLAGRLGIRKNLYNKMLRLITLAPEPFVALVLVLALVNILLFAALNYLPQGPADSFWEDIYVNCPWAIATFILIYVIFNDIKVMEHLKQLVDSIPVTKFADFFEHIERFRERLTEHERNMLDNLILYQHLSDKEIAQLIKLENMDLITTQRLGILKKWGQYAAEHNIDAPLEKLVIVFYVDGSYSRVLPESKNAGLN